MGKGPFAPTENRHLRAMKDRTAVPDRVVPYAPADFTALPHARPLDEYAPLERRAVSLEGYVRFMQHSMDGDFHLEVFPATRDSGPLDALPVTAEITPPWHRGSRLR